MMQIIDDFYFEFDSANLQYDVFRKIDESSDKDYIGSFGSIQEMLKAVHAIMTDSIAKKIGVSKIGDYKRIAATVGASMNALTDCTTL